MTFTTNNIDKVIVSRTLGSVELGLYDRGVRIRELPISIIGSTVGQVLFPVLSPYKKNKTKLFSVFCKSLISISIITFPLFVFIIMHAGAIVKLLLGSQWGNVVPVLEILAFSMLSLMAARVAMSIFFALGKAGFAAINQFVLLVFMLLGVYYGVHYGIVGVAMGVVIATTLHVSVTMVIMSFVLEVSFIKLMQTLIAGSRVAVILFFTYLGVDYFATPVIGEIAVFFIDIIVSLILMLLILRAAPTVLFGKNFQLGLEVAGFLLFRIPFLLKLIKP